MFHCGHCRGPIVWESLPTTPRRPVRYFEDSDPPGMGACLHCSRPFLRLPDGAVVAVERVA